MSLTLLESMSAAPARRPLHRVSAPVNEPPYDDEVEGGVRLGQRIDGSLALAFPLPLNTRPALRLVPDLPLTDVRTGRDITPDRLPAPGPRATQLVRAVLEVLAGDRPARHLARVTASEVQEQLEACASRRASRPWARSLKSMRVSLPGPGVAEVSAVVNRGHRCGALALRMEGLDGRWIITELALL